MISLKRLTEGGPAMLHTQIKNQNKVNKGREDSKDFETSKLRECDLEYKILAAMNITDEENPCAVIINKPPKTAVSLPIVKEAATMPI